MIMGEGQGADAAVALWISVQQSEVMGTPNFHNTPISTQNKILPITA